MDFQAFKEKRNEYVEWMTANGFNEGDCNKNGEFSVLDTFCPHIDLFVDIGANKGIFINRLNPCHSTQLACHCVRAELELFYVPVISQTAENRNIFNEIPRCY